MRPPPTHTLLLLLVYPQYMAVCTLSIILMLARVRDRVSCDHFIPRRSTYVDVLFRPPVLLPNRRTLWASLKRQWRLYPRLITSRKMRLSTSRSVTTPPSTFFFKNNLMIIPSRALMIVVTPLQKNNNIYIYIKKYIYIYIYSMMEYMRKGPSTSSGPSRGRTLLWNVC